jgi:hypothetical protein
MRFLSLFVAVFISQILFSQNWNVFNKNYRYNYKFDNSAIVSNVLFVDTVKQVGVDTVYAMNRIGVECTSGCPTYTSAQGTQTLAVWGNMPQFLQKNIKKYSNGLVMLYDTAKMVIVPTCTVNQSWLFDSISNKTATCIAVYSQTLFGLSDTVKTVMVNSDTIKISKNFGILVFPKPYSQNKYYRLTGIETNGSYSLTALFGEKVPNAWDFYNFSAGDIFSTKKSTTSGAMPGAGSTFAFSTTTIQSKTQATNGYSYNISYATNAAQLPGTMLSVNCSSSIFPGGTVSSGTTTTNYLNLQDPNLFENRMYPGMVIKQSSFSPVNYTIVGSYVSVFPSNIVKFGLDNTGKFYKYMGSSCNYTFPTMPNINAIEGFSLVSNSNGVLTNTYEFNKLCLGVGVGIVNKNFAYFEGGEEFYLASAVKGGTVYFGQPLNVGMKENESDQKNLSVFPNPAQTQFQLNNSEPVKVIIQNALGQEVLYKSIKENEPVDVQNLPNGVYLITIQTSSSTITKKVIIQR